MQVAKADHVLDALHRGRVHRLDAAFRREPQFVPIVVADLDAATLGRDDPGSDGHIEFASGHGLDPYVVTL